MNKNKLPLVSIGVPVYNGEETIESTVQSLLRQDYPNIEIIVSDNGSIDSTFTILETLATQFPKILIFRSQENHGLIWNFNYVFNLSRGEYFMWASHDDEHAVNYISKCVREIQRWPNAALCAPATIATWGQPSSQIWTSSLKSFRGKHDLKSRYIETVRNFPAVALYGVYRSTLVRKTDLLPSVIGGDLLFIQNLSIYGNIIGLEDTLFTYHQRYKWNTVSQDFKVFFAEKKKTNVLFTIYSFLNMASEDSFSILFITF